MGNDKKQLEVGSEFHWQTIPDSPCIQWPQPNIMFSTGREALRCVFKIIQEEHSPNKLFVPEYFCSEVTKWLTKQGIIIKRYCDGPHLDEPVWDTITASKGDAVLAINYFGVRNGDFWKRWQKANDRVFLIEDHSHDPLSSWALNSKADFAFVSLRKTFPVPDGGILWSPRGLRLPSSPICEDWRGSALKLAAMILKKDYLENENRRLKKTFRCFQTDGEKLLGESQLSAISPWSKFMIAAGYPLKWRAARENNVRIFLGLIANDPLFKPLFTDWPSNHCPFNAVLIFFSNFTREKYRLNLIKSGIYPAIHWEVDSDASPDIQDLASKVMTIPVDHRYGVEDIDYIASVISKT